MTTTVSQEAVEVTQADRNAAIQALNAAERQRSFGGNGTVLSQVAEIFARHRQQAERGEVVAWMYERKGFAPAVSMRDPRLRYSDIETLHPLYTLPTPPEAVRTPIEGTSHAD